jgi:hypothetical protein
MRFRQNPRHNTGIIGNYQHILGYNYLEHSCYSGIEFGEGLFIIGHFELEKDNFQININPIVIGETQKIANWAA